MTEKLIFSSSPHIHTSRTVRGSMLHVIVALLPAIFCSLYFFGFPAFTVLCVSGVACTFTEWFITRYMFRRPSTVGDFSAVLTGILLALNLPANLPLWMVAAGSVVAVGIGKMAFGGLGCNIFNPALVGRVFLLISFPVAMTCWPLPDAGFGDADGATGATVLSLVKLGQINPSLLPESDMMWGAIGGSMGEVSGVALLIGFVYLLTARIIKWQIPVAVVLGLVIVDILAGYPVFYDIFSGGLLLGAIFMATDYVTSPMTRRGMLVYGLFIGIITAVIRRWGAYPEGMSFAILIMNGFTPLINRYIKPRRFSPAKKKEVLA